MTEATFDVIYTLEIIITIVLKTIFILALSKYILTTNGGKTDDRRTK